MRYTRILSVIFLVLLMSGSGVGVVSAAENQPTSQPSAGWVFQNNNYGQNVTGQYKIGIANVTYVATYTAKGEQYTVEFPNGSALAVISTRIQNGSFLIMPVDFGGAASVVNEQAVVPDNSETFTPTPMASGDWQDGWQNRDGTDATIISATAYYEYSGGSFPGGASNDLLAIWEGFNTNTGYFLQVTAAWGYVCALTWADDAPAFSIGYGSSLKNCPVGNSVEDDEYEMNIAYDPLVTQEWYFTIYDTTTSTYTLSPDYISAATGTYIPLDNLGLFMEGSSSSVDGTYIPNADQAFFLTDYCDTNANCYFWTQTPHQNINNVPSNVTPYYVNESWGIDSLGWEYCSVSCT